MLIDEAKKCILKTKLFEKVLWKRRMETSPMTCRTLEEFYHIDGHTFEKQYKDVLSGYRDWEQLSHADEWRLFPENMGAHLAIDETSLSNGELYTFVTNRDACTRECSLVAVVAGTKPLCR